jgi:transposase
LRGKDVNDIAELKKQGLSIQAISSLTGFDRKTIRKYLLDAEGVPKYRPRPRAASKLEPFVGYLKERLKVGVWNGSVLFRELKERGYDGGYTRLTDWLRPQRQEANSVAVRRFETPPGQQAQVDWGHLGSIELNGATRKLWGFVFTLGYSRMMMSEAALDQKLGTLLRMHEEAFRQLGGVPREILYDRMKTVWKGTDERGEVLWNSAFLDFARYWGFTPRLCRPYRAQTKGKVESGVKYIRRNFLCGLQGREPKGLEDLNAQLREWVWKVANQRVHGTTHQQVAARWDHDQLELLPLAGRPPYPYVDDERRTVANDAFVTLDTNRYSVPWKHAGQRVQVREQDHGEVEVMCGNQRIARHQLALDRHRVVRNDEHHAGIPLGAQRPHKTLIHIRATAPDVEVRSLASYEQAADGGVQ